MFLGDMYPENPVCYKLWFVTSILVSPLNWQVHYQWISTVSLFFYSVWFMNTFLMFWPSHRLLLDVC